MHPGISSISFTAFSSLLPSITFPSVFSTHSIQHSHTLLNNMRYQILFPVLALLTSFTAAQFPPEPEYLYVLNSTHPGVSISYRNPGICETTKHVKSYSGYVHFEPYAINETGENQSYPLNTFFWFFESRKKPAKAPLVIYLNGGPGGPSSIMAASSHGPCYLNRTTGETYINHDSWNNEANLLFIDQPNHVGFSYDHLHNLTDREYLKDCLLYTSPSPRDGLLSRMPSSA